MTQNRVCAHTLHLIGVASPYARNRALIPATPP
jgi:hypothetical protein